MKSKVVAEWIHKADQDYHAARYLLRKRTPPLYDVVCFHCQQCAEKYLKAYLTSAQIRFPKTHDLMELQTLSRRNDGSFELLKDVLNSLNQYSVRFRYPGEEPDKGEAGAAVKGIEEFRRFIRAKFKA